jgi:hypothetical protein
LKDVNISRLLLRRLSISFKADAFSGASDVQLTAISFDIRQVALPAAALLLVLVLITAITGGVPG